MTKKKTTTLMIIIILFLQCLVFVFYGSRKEGYLYDEIITFQRASEMFADSSKRVDFEEQTDFYNKIYTSDDFTNDLTVSEGESFFDQSFYEKYIDALLTKRTYNVFLNIIMSLGDGTANDWYSIGFNICLFIFTQLGIYCIAKQLGLSNQTTLIALIFYGFSVAGIKPVIYIRFYEFFLLLAMLFLAAGIWLYKKENVDFKWILMAFSTLILTWFGYLNAEYMIVYAAAFSVAFVVVCLYRHQWIKMWSYIAVYACAGIGFLAYKWNGLKQTYAVGGLFTQSVDKFFKGNWIEFIKYVYFFIKDILQDGGVFILFLVIIVLFLMNKDKSAMLRQIKEKINSSWFLVLLTVVIYILVVARVAPYEAWRYTSIMQPLVVLLFCVVLDGMLMKTNFKKFSSYAIVISQMIYLIFWGNSMGCLHGEARHDMKAISNQILAGTQSVMFSSGDTGDLYYGAYIWPENAEIYVTTVDLYAEETEEKAEILQDDTIYAWVRNEETWNNEVSRLLQEDGYTSAQLVLDTGSTRWLIYKCER